MKNIDFDFAIVGSGFGGSLLALIARQLGRSVLLLERGRHPRFVIGESTTPLANLVWGELTRAYELHELAPFAKWGSWQAEHPELPVGLKRGFTFYHHGFDQPFLCRPERDHELLVAASRFDDEADTHWYRPDFDAHLVTCAQRRDVEFLDDCTVNELEFRGDTVRLGFQQRGRDRQVRVGFVVDATGPRGTLAQLLKLSRPASALRTEGLYTHFRNVRRWDALRSLPETPPYPVDDAAMHHVFDGGWIWVLRFNNGVTSAGVAIREHLARQLRLEEGAPAWARLLSRLPSVREQFAEAEFEFPLIHHVPLSFRAGPVTGPRWALLPSAAGFLDPLLSTGFPLTLLGLERLARILERDYGRSRFEEQLRYYADRTVRELDRVETLITALYAAMPDFPMFARLSLLYFAAAAFTENARRRGQPRAAGDLFLLGEHPELGPELPTLCREIRAAYAGGLPAPTERQRLWTELGRVLAPVDEGGLGDPEHRNWHPLITA